MSLRWHLCGLHLSNLWQTLGSQDLSLLNDLAASLDRRVAEALEEGGFDDPSEAQEYRSSVYQILERAVREGAPFPDLRGEHQFHLDAADALARAGQTVHETVSWDWKHGAWFELHDWLAPTLGAAERQLLDWLVLGRPVFGSEFDTDWGFYTYLSAGEATTLRATLDRAIQEGSCPPPVRDRHFARELVGWLDDIRGRGLDVWVRAE
jgi:hypothetical protein